MTPSVLRQGSRIAIVSPASAAKPDLVYAGIARLRTFGYDPVLMPHALAHGPLYYAGTPEERVADLHAAFADPGIDGILCTRGGWGSAELLPLLDRDLIRANPKVFAGYSDQTSLHVWLWKECRLPTFYAPMAASDWSKVDGVDRRTWRAAVEGNDPWTVSVSDGLRLMRDGRAKGRLLGGCLSILTAALGTPWQPSIEESCILFLEDTGTRPYQWDRMLQHLRFAGQLKEVRGIVFGDMLANGSPSDMPLLRSACMHALRDFDGPILIGLRSGHVDRSNRTVPLGAWVTLDGTELTATPEFDPSLSTNDAAQT